MYVYVVPLGSEEEPTAALNIQRLQQGGLVALIYTRTTINFLKL